MAISLKHGKQVIGKVLERLVAVPTSGGALRGICDLAQHLGHESHEIV